MAVSHRRRGAIVEVGARPQAVCRNNTRRMQRRQVAARGAKTQPPQPVRTSSPALRRCPPAGRRWRRVRGCAIVGTEALANRNRRVVGLRPAR